MTGFSLVYDENHEYNEGIIEIPNTTSNLKMAYLAISSSVSNALSAPILRGFLYQVQVDGKRSRPYPIVSDRQTIRLDMSECEKFLFVPSNRIINEYSIALYVSTESGGGETVVDLSDYVLQVDFDALTATVAGLTSGLSETNLDVVGVGSRVTTLEENVETLQGTVAALESTVEALDIPTATTNYSLISADGSLSSGVRYLATVADLVCALPSSPSAGDVVSLSTGNFSFKVTHGNSSQQILNNNTLTAVGADNGIVLKPYSHVELIYMGANLWKTAYRARTINNFTPIVQESTASSKSYTATAPVAAYGAVIANMYNGVKTVGALTNGYLSDVTQGDFLITLAEPIVIDQIRIWNGQGNVGTGASSGYRFNDMIVYTGHSTSGENLGSYSFDNVTATEQIKSITPNTAPSSTFLLKINSISPVVMGCLELEIWGKGAVGGEISV